jgi:hypothetical protein
MRNDNLNSLILRNAKMINEMQQKIKQTYTARSVNPEAWKEACLVFHNSYDSLAFPGWLARGLELLAQKNPEIINAVIAYLKADPICFRSGYTKQKILLLLKRFDLSQKQRRQLQEIIINNLQSKHRFEFQSYSRLALKITDLQFEEQVENIIKHSHDKRTIRRAKGILELLRK